jgi:hypothetical protein
MALVLDVRPAHMYLGTRLLRNHSNEGSRKSRLDSIIHVKELSSEDTGSKSSDIGFGSKKC